MNSRLNSLAIALALVALPAAAQTLQQPVQPPIVTPQRPPIRAPLTVGTAVQPVQFTVTPATLYGGESAEVVVVMPQAASQRVTVVISPPPGTTDADLELPRVEIPAGATRGVATIRARPALLGDFTASPATLYAHVGALDTTRSPAATIVTRAGTRNPAILCDRISGLAVRFTGAPIELRDLSGYGVPEAGLETADLSPGAPVTVELTADCIPRTPVSVPLEWRRVARPPSQDVAVQSATAPMNAPHIGTAELVAEFQRIFGGLPTTVTLPANQRSVAFSYTAGTSMLTLEAELRAPTLVSMPRSLGHPFYRQGERLRLRSTPACRESYSLAPPPGAGTVLRAGATGTVTVQVPCHLVPPPHGWRANYPASEYRGLRRFRVISSDPQALPVPDQIFEIEENQASLRIPLTAGAVTTPRNVSLHVQPVETAAPASAPLNLSVTP